MRIRMRINANAHQSVNARICIECALQVLCEQAKTYNTYCNGINEIPRYNYRMAGNFGGKVFWQIVENISFGRIYSGD